MSISTAKAAALLGAVAGLALAAGGPASAFPKPRYPTTVPNVSTAQAPPQVASRAIVASSTLPVAKANPANAAEKPAAAPVARPAAGAKTWSVYVVQRGDTLSGVGRRFGAPIRTLADLNELDPKAPLRAGMKLKLPPGTADSGKDPYASGPSPFALADGGSARTAAAKPRAAKLAQAEPQRAPASSSVPRSAPAEAKPAAARPAPTEAPPAELSIAAAAAAPKAALPAPKPAPVEPAPTEPADLADPAVAAGHGRFVWPVKGPILSRFGPLGPGERNDGVNIGADQGANVRAAAAGEVVYAGSDVKGFGNVVLIKHPDGWVTAYAHLGGIGVRIRDHVEQGQTIGTVGKSGGVDQPQLHFEARWSSAPRDKHKPVDPLKLLP